MMIVMHRIAWRRFLWTPEGASMERHHSTCLSGASDERRVPFHRSAWRRFNWAPEGASMERPHSTSLSGASNERRATFHRSAWRRLIWAPEGDSLETDHRKSFSGAWDERRVAFLRIAGRWLIWAHEGDSLVTHHTTSLIASVPLNIARIENLSKWMLVEDSMRYRSFTLHFWKLWHQCKANARKKNCVWGNAYNSQKQMGRALWASSARSRIVLQRVNLLNLKHFKIAPHGKLCAHTKPPKIILQKQNYQRHKLIILLQIIYIAYFIYK